VITGNLSTLDELVYFEKEETFVYFLRKYLLLISTAIGFRKFKKKKKLVSKNIFFGLQRSKTLKSIYRLTVSLIDKRTVICDHIKYLNKFDCQAIVQCKVMIDNNVDRMSVNIFPFFRSHCQLKEAGSVDPDLVNIYQINQDQFLCFVFVTYGPNPDFLSVFQSNIR
jgi:hypothetical protein